MKKLREILGEDKKSDTTGLQIGPVKFRKASDIGSDILSGLGSAASAVGTGFNQVMNPIRRAVGVTPSQLPPGKKEVDYGAAFDVYDKAMSGFGGAYTGKKTVETQNSNSKKIQDRVPQEIPRSDLDKAPERKNSVALQRQMSGDKSLAPQTMQDKLNMMNLKADVDYKRFADKQEKDFQTAMQASQNKKLAPASNEKAPVDKTKLEPKVAARPVVTQTGYPAAEKPKAPIPKVKPEQSEITIQPKQKIWDIAGGDPNRVKEILKLNPGLNPKKIPIGYKLKLK